MENPMVKTYIFKGNLGAKPGQFVNVWMPRVDEKPFSVAYCDDKEFWLTIAAVGPFTKKLHKDFVKGSKLGVRGPYGNGYTVLKNKHIVLLAGGYGAAPLYFLAHESVKNGCKVEFIVGAKNKDLLLYTEMISKMENVSLHIATDDGSVGMKGYNTLILEKLLAEQNGSSDGHGIAELFVATCGPEVMMKSAMDICEKADVPIEVSIERYMKCGTGVCGNCCVDGLGVPVCKKGPVMRGEMARKISGLAKWHRDNVGLKINW